MAIDPNLDPPIIGRHNGYDIYPMPMFVRLEAIDMAATVRWYREALEFGVMFEMPMMAHLRRKKFQDLLIFAGGRGEADGGLSLSFSAEGELEALWRRASAAGEVGKSKVMGPPEVKPWNARELTLFDPDGRRLVFFEQVNDPEMAARMQAMFKAADAGVGGR